MKFKNELEKIENTYFGKNKCIIIGNPVEHSLSPAMHNIAYKNCNIDDKFIFDKITVKEEELEEFIFDLKDINKKTNSFVGLTCTMPHKQNIIKYLDEIKNEAKIIGAVNSVLIKDNKFIGYNTDWYGVERPFMERCINLTNKKVAIIGAGGASRSAIYTFKKNNSVVNIFNRTKEKADLLAKEFNCNSYNLQDMDVLESSDIIINTTNVGMGELENISPINTDVLNKNHIVFECIYKPKETELIKKAKNVGATIIYGWEMLLYQGVKQFEIYTSIKPNVDIMRGVLL